MSTILTSAIITNAISSVDSYSGKIQALNDELNGVVTTLTTTNFIGDASNGYKAFYDKNVVPAVTENLIESNASLMASLKTMLENIKTQLLDTVDPQLGDNNANAGSGVE